MHVQRFDDVTLFLAASEGIRAAEPVLTNMIGSIASGILAGRRYDTCGWWTVTDDAGNCVGCAARTSPFNLVISPMPAAAAAALGRLVADVDPLLPGVTGPRDVVDALLGAFASTRVRRLRMTELAHVLTDYRPAPPVPGNARRAASSELDRLVDWHEQFALDTGMPVDQLRQGVAARLERSALFWWEVDGDPVAMAGHAPLVDTPDGPVGRIGPVYTPASFRGRGFGSAVTGAVVDELLPRCSTIMLFTDATNPTSNSIYARLGFRPVAEVVDIALVEPR